MDGFVVCMSFYEYVNISLLVQYLSQFAQCLFSSLVQTGTSRLKQQFV
ncbi:hypothetical protein EVA_15761 [gut metagenome]|uniref:Uncharacterized protein n=1 Tax=gut metagenome TaxID=749906 RepID=J9G9L6_9ZZZZ